MKTPHGDTLLGLTAVPHRNILFGLVAVPHDDIDYFFTSQRWSIFSAPHGNIDFSSPHKDDQFFLCLTAALPASPAISNGPILKLHCPIGFLTSCFYVHSPWIIACPPWEPLGLLLWLQAQCLKCSSRQNVAMLWLDWQKLKAAPFIHAGIALLTTPGDKQPSRPFWCSLTKMMGYALASDEPLKNSIDNLISEGRLLSWYIMDICNQPTELALSKSFLIRGLTFMPWL
jgi:hypothetical protein